MKYLFVILPFCFLTCKYFEPDIAARVTGIKDGDTIEVLDSNRQTLIIRLAHVDCPERNQPYSDKARQFTSDFCFGKPITLRQTDTDRYGRLVCEVFVHGKSLNLALVQNGLAWHFKKYSTDPTFAEAEQAARNAKTGLWADAGPVPPWEWRAQRRK